MLAKKRISSEDIYILQLMDEPEEIVETVKKLLTV
jgi:hypothetical protein